MPIYGCGLGLHGLTVSTALRNGPVADVAIGASADFERDLRENWDNETSTGATLGYNPDTAYNRKYRLTVIPTLPIDPARQAARLGMLANGTTRATHRHPNLTDSELDRFGTTAWDQRFYRKGTIIASGGDFGPKIGIGVTGLALNPKIDDAEFTMFMVGYFQSSSPRLGNRDLRYWSGSGGFRSGQHPACGRFQRLDGRCSWQRHHGPGLGRRFHRRRDQLRRDHRFVPRYVHRGLLERPGQEPVERSRHCSDLQPRFDGYRVAHRRPGDER
ncbi:MAG: hypothetical protein MZV64_34640 [Ignavibacteriales bacterium]|nr:hypothetical protein [Ignavibacteriales bacterium]